MTLELKYRWAIGVSVVFFGIAVLLLYLTLSNRSEGRNVGPLPTDPEQPTPSPNPPYNPTALSFNKPDYKLATNVPLTSIYGPPLAVSSTVNQAVIVCAALNSNEGTLDAIFFRRIVGTSPPEYIQESTGTVTDGATHTVRGITVREDDPAATSGMIVVSYRTKSKNIGYVKTFFWSDFFVVREGYDLENESVAQQDDNFGRAVAVDSGLLYVSTRYASNESAGSIQVFNAATGAFVRNVNPSGFTLQGNPYTWGERFVVSDSHMAVTYNNLEVWTMNYDSNKNLWNRVQVIKNPNAKVSSTVMNLAWSSNLQVMLFTKSPVLYMYVRGDLSNYGENAWQYSDKFESSNNGSDVSIATGGQQVYLTRDDRKLQVVNINMRSFLFELTDVQTLAASGPFAKLKVDTLNDGLLVASDARNEASTIFVYSMDDVSKLS